MWATVWEAFSGIGTVGTLAYTLVLFRGERWRNRSAEARQVVVWIQSPGASTDGGINTYHNTFHLVNESPRPVHSVDIQVSIPGRRVYERRAMSVRSLDPPHYNRQHMRGLLTIPWAFMDGGGLLETVVAGDRRQKEFTSLVPMRCVDVLVEFFDGDGQRWKKNITTGKLKLMD